MKVFGDKTDQISPIRVLSDEFLRFHPATKEMISPIYIATERVGLIRGESWDAGTHDGIRDGGGSTADRWEILLVVYYDDDGLTEAGLSKPEPVPIKEVRTCKNGCPTGFHICTK